MTSEREGAGPTRLVVEADGGSRGNPGVAGYGALVRDGDTGQVLVERAAPLGTASNNVAEYSGLIAGLEAADEVDPGADVEVRMDSKLVIEQMSGRWKIKHEDMRRLAGQARELASARVERGGGVSYEWVPRARNKAADALSNEGMDGHTVHRRHRPDGEARDEAPDGEDAPDDRAPDDAATDHVASGEAGSDDTSPDDTGSDDAGSSEAETASSPPAPDTGPPARIVLVRHGLTEHTRTSLLDGRGGPDAPLTAEGRRQAEAAGHGVRAFLGDRPVRLVTSALSRARQSGAVMGSVLDASPETDAAWDEQHFGDWEGLDAAALSAGDPQTYGRLRQDEDYARPGGESRALLRERVAEAFRRLAAEAFEDGRPVVVVSHRTALLALLSDCLQMAPAGAWSLAIAPGSLTSILCWRDGGLLVEFVNDTSHLR